MPKSIALRLLFAAQLRHLELGQSNPPIIQVHCGRKESIREIIPQKVCIANLPALSTLGLMRREYDVAIERDGEGYFVASAPALPGCHTQAKSLDKLQSRITEAISLWLER